MHIAGNGCGMTCVSESPRQFLFKVDCTEHDYNRHPKRKLMLVVELSWDVFLARCDDEFACSLKGAEKEGSLGGILSHHLQEYSSKFSQLLCSDSNCHTLRKHLPGFPHGPATQSFSHLFQFSHSLHASKHHFWPFSTFAYTTEMKVFHDDNSSVVYVENTSCVGVMTVVMRFFCILHREIWKGNRFHGKSLGFLAGGGVFHRITSTIP